MTPQIISAVVNTNHLTVQFGSLSFDMKRGNMKKGVIPSTGDLPTKLIFRGAKFLKKLEEKKHRDTIQFAYIPLG
jgi:hypothetical protein